MRSWGVRWAGLGRLKRRYGGSICCDGTEEEDLEFALVVTVPDVVEECLDVDELDDSLGYRMLKRRYRCLIRTIFAGLGFASLRFGQG